MDDQTAPPPNSVPPAATEPASAGFWLRAGAYVIDGFVLGIATLPALLLPEGPGLAARILLPAAYFTVWPVLFNGRTLGKTAAGLAIVREDGSPLSYGRSFLRWIGYVLSSVTLCLGFLCALFTPRKRALQDYLAGTRVVRVRELGLARKIAVILVGVLVPPLVALGLAVSLAVPDVASLNARVKEGGAVSRLAGVRTALSIAYGDASGRYPADLGSLVPKYLPGLDAPALPEHPTAAGVEVYGPEICSGIAEYGRELNADKLRDTGKWGYVVAPKAPCDGEVFIDCTHKDSGGRAWHSY